MFNVHSLRGFGAQAWRILAWRGRAARQVSTNRRGEPMGESMTSPTASTQHVKNSEDPREALTQYHKLRDRAESADLDQKRAIFPKIVNHFYDVVTDFYEFAWGQSFHFAPRKRDESFADSIVRHQHVLADKLELASGKRFLDIGCGVGGPLQGVARHSGATGVGVNNNAYQISRGELHFIRRIIFHEAIVLAISQISAFTSTCLAH